MKAISIHTPYTTNLPLWMNTPLIFSTDRALLLSISSYLLFSFLLVASQITQSPPTEIPLTTQIKMRRVESEGKQTLEVLFLPNPLLLLWFTRASVEWLLCKNLLLNLQEFYKLVVKLLVVLRHHGWSIYTNWNFFPPAVSTVSYFISVSTDLRAWLSSSVPVKACGVFPLKSRR